MKQLKAEAGIVFAIKNICVAGLFLSSPPAFAQSAPPPSPFAQPAPNAGNDCGRAGPTFLRPIASSHKIAPYPADAVRNHEQGRVLLRVVVDGNGSARDVSVTRSSGYSDLDDAAATFVKENWRWQPPPDECADKGVIVPVFYNWSIPGLAP
jgi:protein TonB